MTELETKIQKLNELLSDQSYIGGYTPTQEDNLVFESLANCCLANLPHLQRWYNHIKSFGVERSLFPNTSKMGVKVREIFNMHVCITEMLCCVYVFCISRFRLNHKSY